MMKIAEHLPLGLIEARLKATDRSGVLRELVDRLGAHEPGLDLQESYQVLAEREKLGSTGVGSGIAIPHAKMNGLKKILLAFGRSPAGIEFDSLDGLPAHLFFLILAPDNSVGAHLSLLARISRLCSDPDIPDQLMKAVDAAQIRRIIESADQLE